MGSNYHVQFFGKGVDIYFQAQSSYQATPLFFQSMYIVFFRSFILDILNFQAISKSISLVLRFFCFCIYIYIYGFMQHFHNIVMIN
jgi:hypothetical protein